MKVLLCICAVLAFAAGQRITTIQLDGVQYFVSRMNPYSPELNYFLAYQYCRSLGLQLASFETKEKVESMTEYLKNAGYSRYDFWTSGNRLGTGMFLWMSTGLPFNATFEYFEGTNPMMQNLDVMDHNANTAPQRTARDRTVFRYYSSSGMEKGCVVLKAPQLMWAPEDCLAVKDFICEQTRCYYYNYGSIPVSSAQGRPITTTTTASPFGSTTPTIPIAMSLNLNSEPAAPLAPQRKKNLNLGDKDDMIDMMIKATKVQLKTDMVESDEVPKPIATQEPAEAAVGTTVAEENDSTDAAAAEEDQNEEHHTSNEAETEIEEEEEPTAASEVEVTTTVEQRLKQITEEVGKIASEAVVQPVADVGHQSFMSLTDLIRNLRPNDKVQPQIDIASDYSNTMRGGETGAVIVESSRKVRNSQQVY